MQKKSNFLVRSMYFVMLLFGLCVGGSIGAWAGVSMLVVVNGRARSLAELRSEGWAFPEIPKWLHDKNPNLANITLAAFGLLGLAGGGVIARGIWRRQALRRFGWTREEIEAFE